MSQIAKRVIRKGVETFEVPSIGNSLAIDNNILSLKEETQILTVRLDTPTAGVYTSEVVVPAGNTLLWTMVRGSQFTGAGSATINDGVADIVDVSDATTPTISTTATTIHNQSLTVDTTFTFSVTALTNEASGYILFLLGYKPSNPVTVTQVVDEG